MRNEAADLGDKSNDDEEHWGQQQRDQDFNASVTLTTFREPASTVAPVGLDPFDVALRPAGLVLAT